MRSRFLKLFVIPVLILCLLTGCVELEGSTTESTGGFTPPSGKATTEEVAESTEETTLPETEIESETDVTEESDSSKLGLSVSLSETEDTSMETEAAEATETSQSKETLPETENASETEPEPSESPRPEKQGFEVHFIDVGQGDSSLVICDGEVMLIDGGSTSKSSVVYTYLKKNHITSIKYFVATHPDEDHIGGLAAALQSTCVDRAFSPVLEYDSDPFAAMVKYLKKQGKELELPEVGAELALGSATVTILAPMESFEENNNNSIVIRVQYGNTSFLFTGDAEYEEEESLLSSGATLESTVLKIAHHGSEYSTSKKFLKKVNPSVAIISCGSENTYGFPTQSVLDRLQNRGVDVYRTDLQGDIVVYSDGESITVETAKETEEDIFLAPALIVETTEEESVTESTTTASNDSDSSGSGEINEDNCDYIANTNTYKFHRPYCKSVKQMKEKNKWYFVGDRQDLIDRGYVPCKNCDP